MPSIVRHLLAALLLAATTLGAGLASHYEHTHQAAVVHRSIRPAAVHTASCGTTRPPRHTSKHPPPRPTRSPTPAEPVHQGLDVGPLAPLGHWLNQRIFAGWRQLTRSVLHPGPSPNTTLVDRP
jgi:hypothetical protein